MPTSMYSQKLNIYLSFETWANYGSYIELSSYDSKIVIIVTGSALHKIGFTFTLTMFWFYSD